MMGHWSDVDTQLQDQRRLPALRGYVAERLVQHRENLAGWSEGEWCQACKGVGHLPYREPRSCLLCNGRGVTGAGYLIPTEPDSVEREAVRRELKAAISELEAIERMLNS